MNLHSCERNNAWKTQKLEGEEEGGGGGRERGKKRWKFGSEIVRGRNGGGTMVDRRMETIERRENSIRDVMRKLNCSSIIQKKKKKEEEKLYTRV